MKHPDDSDEREYRGTASPCPFCDEGRAAQAVAAAGTVFAVYDSYPVTEGHLLVIPRRHTPDFFSMTGEERSDALSLIDPLAGRVPRTPRW